MTAQGLKVYTFKGKFGATASQCTVDFGRDGDSFRANGSVGTSSIAITCAPQPPGTKKWPVGGTIDGQALALTVDLTEKDSLLAGTLGPATFQFGLTDYRSGPDAGESGGSKGATSRFNELDGIKPKILELKRVWDRRGVIHVQTGHTPHRAEPRIRGTNAELRGDAVLVDEATEPVC